MSSRSGQLRTLGCRLIYQQWWWLVGSISFKLSAGQRNETRKRAEDNPLLPSLEITKSKVSRSPRAKSRVIHGLNREANLFMKQGKCES